MVSRKNLTFYAITSSLGARSTRRGKFRTETRGDEERGQLENPEIPGFSWTQVTPFAETGSPSKVSGVMSAVAERCANVALGLADEKMARVSLIDASGAATHLVVLRKTLGFWGFRDFETDHRLRFVKFSFEIFIGGFNGPPVTKLAKWEIANMIFEQKREETKTMVYSKTRVGAADRN